MNDWPPSPDEIAELPVDELASRLLPFLAKNGRQHLHRGNLTGINALSTHLMIDSNDLRVRRAVAEAYDWLVFHGLIAHKPGNEGEWAYITPRGERFIADPHGLRTIKATQRIDLDLHPLIASRVRSQFLLGEFENAVLLAFREVEIRVRDLGGFDASQIGVKLMRQAFKPDGGSLVDSNLDMGEQVATMELFAGAIGAFKNPSSHRQVDYEDATVAAEAVLLADLLLRILDRYDASQP